MSLEEAADGSEGKMGATGGWESAISRRGNSLSWFRSTTASFSRSSGSTSASASCCNASEASEVVKIESYIMIMVLNRMVNGVD